MRSPAGSCASSWILPSLLRRFNVDSASGEEPGNVFDNLTIQVCGEFDYVAKRRPGPRSGYQVAA